MLSQCIYRNAYRNAMSFKLERKRKNEAESEKSVPGVARRLLYNYNSCPGSLPGPSRVREALVLSSTNSTSSSCTPPATLIG